MVTLHSMICTNLSPDHCVPTSAQITVYWDQPRLLCTGISPGYRVLGSAQVTVYCYQSNHVNQVRLKFSELGLIFVIERSGFYRKLNLV